MVRPLEAERRTALYESVVTRWETAADEVGGSVGFAHRQHALELAKSFGLSDAVARVRVRLQEQDPETMGLAEVLQASQAYGDSESGVGLSWQIGKKG
jgi:hypothetical protein